MKSVTVDAYDQLENTTLAMIVFLNIYGKSIVCL